MNCKQDGTMSQEEFKKVRYRVLNNLTKAQEDFMIEQEKEK